MMNERAGFALKYALLFAKILLSLTEEVKEPASVTVISITSFQYLLVIPGYEAGIRYVNERYNTTALTFQHVLIFRKEIYSCDVIADYSVEFASDFFYRRNRSPNNLYIFSAPMCSGELLLLAPVVREWNVPVVSIVGTNPVISNRRKYPTALTTAPLNNSVLTAFFKKFLLRYGWTTVALLCDDNNVVAYYKANCINFQTTLARPEFLVNVLTYDSRKGSVDYSLILHSASQFARVFIILARSEVTRNFLIWAHQQNLTQGDYVYFYIEPHSKSNLPEFPNLSWQMNDPNDDVARAAFASLLVIAFDNGPNVNSLPKSAADFIKRQSAEKYGFVMPPEQKVSAIAVAAFETILMFAQVANETLTLAKEIPLSDGRHFSDQFLNRTFVLPTGHLYITAGGERFPDILASQLNSTTGEIQPVVFYESSTTDLSQPFFRDFVWTGGKRPLNEPFCGFNGKKLICSQEGKMGRSLLAAIIATTLVVFFVACVLAVLSYRCLSWRFALAERWWQLESCNLDTNGVKKITNSNFFKRHREFSQEL